MSFTPRLTKPESGNPYYNTIARGGYSRAIVGSPTDPGCNVLSNCVGYAFGRANEIMQSKSMAYLAPVNAENFVEYRGNLQTGQIPKVGAIMCWQKGTLSNSDGAGHVAVVEKVIDNYTVVTSESAYNGTAFYTMTRRKADGNWGMGSAYSFRCFIYLPISQTSSTSSSTPTSVPTNTTHPSSTIKVGQPMLAVGSKGRPVKTLQILLNGYGFDCGEPDEIFGGKTKQAVIQYQSRNCPPADGVVGSNTWASLLGWR